jgi:hypothetical protein
MNEPSPATNGATPASASSGALLEERRLRLARIAWVAVSLTTVVLNITASPDLFTAYFRYTPQLVQFLHQLNLSPTLHSVLGMLFNTVGLQLIYLLLGILLPASITDNQVLANLNPTFPVAFSMIPIFIVIAILRSRLWDIDTLINKALVYGSLTALLTLLFVGLIVGIERLASLVAGPAATSPVSLVISTLVIAALFQPLRTRIQAVIDRAFFRQKYDAAQTLAAFGVSLGQEVDLEQIREHLLAVTSQTLQPAHLSLWLHPSPVGHLPTESASPLQSSPDPSRLVDGAAPHRRSTPPTKAHPSS